MFYLGSNGWAWESRRRLDNANIKTVSLAKAVNFPCCCFKKF